MKNKFRSWFEQQFRNLPNPERLNKLCERREVLEAQLGVVKHEIVKLESLQLSLTASLYAYSAFGIQEIRHRRIDYARRAKKKT